MRNDTYLSVLLTVTACLLTVDLWTRLSDRPVLAQQVEAQSRSRNPNARSVPQKGVGTSLSDGVTQRREIIELLKGLTTQVSGLRSELTSGALKVEIANLPQGVGGR
ncbi:MAG: hypothetical protein MK101_07075 [Phycisphaerales bacterium]|nr:hypothetical protein [Phycisphaerales bacterium]